MLFSFDELNPKKKNPLTSNLIGIVSCGKAKLNHAAPACEMYTGALTKKGILWMQRNFDRWYILSAKYGLLAPELEIEPYNVTIPSLDEEQLKKWKKKVQMQMRLMKITHRIKIMLTGVEYFTAYPWPNAHRVIEGLKLGERSRWLNEHPELTEALLKKIMRKK